MGNKSRENGEHENREKVVFYDQDAVVPCGADEEDLMFNERRNIHANRYPIAASQNLTQQVKGEKRRDSRGKQSQALPFLSETPPPLLTVVTMCHVKKSLRLRRTTLS